MSKGDIKRYATGIIPIIVLLYVAITADLFPLSELDDAFVVFLGFFINFVLNSV